MIVFKFIFVRPRSGRSRHQLLAAAQVPSQVCPLHLLCNASNICICFSICSCISISICICVLSKAESRLCIQNILYLCLCVFCATLQTFVFALFGFSFEFVFVCSYHPNSELLWPSTQPFGIKVLYFCYEFVFGRFRAGTWDATTRNKGGVTLAASIRIRTFADICISPFYRSFVVKAAIRER